MKDAKPKGRRSKQRTVLTVLCVVLAVILALLILATAYVESLFGKINRDNTVSSLSPSELADLVGNETKPSDLDPTRETATLPQISAEIIDSENTVNILLVGSDKGGNLSDAMILCSIHKDQKTITLVSFQRDSYVDIPGYFPHKLNTSYALGGFDVLNDTLESNFGIQVDGNVAVDFDGFMDVIDTIGGIEMELTSEEAEHLNWKFGWDLTEGMNYLNGEQALNYARIRAIDADADFARTNRQRKVIAAVMDEVKGMSLSEINSLLNELLPLVSTDLTNSEIIGYAMDLYPLLSDSTITTQQIPAEGTFYLDWVDQDGGMSIIRISDFDTNIEILREIISG